MPARSPETSSSGYLHPDYAASLREFGEARALSRSGGFLLERTILGSDFRDAASPYPLLACRDWSSLGEDLEECAHLVSVTVVTDPFASTSQVELARVFPDLCRPYKEHFVVDLKRFDQSRHRRSRVAQILRTMRVEVLDQPLEWLEGWESLYAELRARKGLRGISAFSRDAFRMQLGIPGCVGFSALSGDRCLSMGLWYVLGETAYYHLAASSDDGYALSASHALVDAAVRTFAERHVVRLDLGAGAGAHADSVDDGLSRFKSGWATGTCPVYLCGRIIQPDAYARLAVSVGASQRPYFPAYRGADLS